MTPGGSAVLPAGVWDQINQKAISMEENMLFDAKMKFLDGLVLPKYLVKVR
jgi:hypothetical protein